MKCGLLLDVVVRQRTTVLELLTGENQTLLIGWNTLLILDLALHIVNSIATLNLKRDSLPSQCFYKYLHAATKTEHQVESRLLLDVVVRQRTTVLELLTGENQTLLVWWNTLLILDL